MWSERHDGERQLGKQQPQQTVVGDTEGSHRSYCGRIGAVPTGVLDGYEITGDVNTDSSIGSR